MADRQSDSAVNTTYSRYVYRVVNKAGEVVYSELRVVDAYDQLDRLSAIGRSDGPFRIQRRQVTEWEDFDA